MYKRVVMPEKGFLYGYVMPWLTIVVLTLLIAITVGVNWYQTTHDDVMRDEMAEDMD